jgi:hypothetical protein
MPIENARIINDDPTRFGIEIDFKKGVGDPSRIFRVMSELIGALQNLDKGLIGTIDTKLEPILLLEDVETGSIRSWLRQAVKSDDNDAPQKDDIKAIVGAYLVKSKYIIIDFLSKRTEITNTEQVSALEAQLLKTAKETGVKQIPAYVPPSRYRLLQSIDKIGEALDPLSPEDKATYLSPDGNAEFNLAFHITPEKIEDLATSDIIKNNVTLIMKVKKPDFLGESKWEFKHDGRVIEAKMLDQEWVSEYQAGKIPIIPGDAIKAKVQVIAKYGTNSETISTQYTIQKVLQVIQKDNSDKEASQDPLFH